MKIKFYNIPEKIKCLEYDGDKTDLRLHLDEHISWFEEDEVKYISIEKDIDVKEIKRLHYTVYAWCDASGYDYWMKQQEEHNYIQITVSFDKDYISTNDIKQLGNDLDEMYEYFSKYESFNPDF